MNALSVSRLLAKKHVLKIVMIKVSKNSVFIGDKNVICGFGGSK